MCDRDTIAATVKNILVDVLAVDAAELKGGARFFLDLDGESIEILETQFQIEKKLKLSVNFQKILGGESLLTDGAGFLTPQSLGRIRSALPFLQLDRLPPDATLDTLVRELLTVDAIIEITWQAAQEREQGNPVAAN